MRAFVAASLVALWASPVLATSSVSCASLDFNQRVDLTLGDVPGAAVVGAGIEFGKTRWSLVDGDIAVGQAFFEDQRWMIDFVDPNFERILASLRLLQASEAGDYVLDGILIVPGEGAWPLICEGP
ncbi:MAG: hypothetical protein H6873_07365 [Hyphomicrobiaceae bacterium]|nr:hypothetical protein [Hyphomicrobiaceae bacterium]